MLLRDDESVTEKDGAVIQESERLVILEYDICSHSPGRDVAEKAHSLPIAHSGGRLTVGVPGKDKTMIDVSRGTIVVYSDIGCPWAHLAVFRLHRARSKLGMGDQVHFDHRAFPLELFNERPTPKRTLDAEIPVTGGAEPDAGFQLWNRPDFEYPVTTLPALEAVQAAKEQSLRASEQLDLALRVAFFGESRTISMRHVILEVAQLCPDVDAEEIAAALDDGRARRSVMEQMKVAEGDEVRGSPHLFLADGSDEHNPGMKMEWVEEGDKKGPVIHEDRPEIYLDLLQRAAGTD